MGFGERRKPRAHGPATHCAAEATRLSTFTLISSLRILSYIPQILRAARDTGGVSAISITTSIPALASRDDRIRRRLCRRFANGDDLLCQCVGLRSHRRHYPPEAQTSRHRRGWPTREAGAAGGRSDEQLSFATLPPAGWAPLFILTSRSHFWKIEALTEPYWLKHHEGCPRYPSQSAQRTNPLSREGCVCGAGGQAWRWWPAEGVEG